MDRRTKELTAEQQAAKDYLEVVRSLSIEIDERAEHIRELRERARSAGGYDPTACRGRQGDRADRVGKAAARIADAEAALLTMFEQYLQRRKETSALLDKLENVDDMCILSGRYIRREKWQDIADFLDIDYRYATRLHRRALQSFGELLTREGVGAVQHSQARPFDTIGQKAAVRDTPTTPPADD